MYGVKKTCPNFYKQFTIKSDIVCLCCIFLFSTYLSVALDAQKDVTKQRRTKTYVFLNICMHATLFSEINVP